MSDSRVRAFLKELERFSEKPTPGGEWTIPVKDLVENLRRAVDAPDTPTIIRTVEELEVLDPDTVVINSSGNARTVDETITQYRYRTIYYAILPAVVVTPAEQVRAARKALEEA